MKEQGRPSLEGDFGQGKGREAEEIRNDKAKDREAEGVGRG